MHPFEDELRLAGDVPESAEAISFTGTDIQKRIRAGKKVPDWASFPEVIEELQKTYPPPSKQGFTIFCTGLSGAGKSTIAKILYARFLEIGTRPVTLLDGDIVRRNLSSELNFSKEHRDIAAIRRSIEAHGGFIEVHVATPIAECERRDRKGMYARARAGLMHLVAMAIFAFLACVSFKTLWAQAGAVVFVFVFSGLMEVLQHFSPPRTGSWEDVAMNAMGCLASLIVVIGGLGIGPNR